jgi:hypothetical protein
VSKLNKTLSVTIFFHIYFLHFPEWIFRIYEFFITVKPSSNRIFQFLVSGLGAGFPALSTLAFIKFNSSIPCLRSGPLGPRFTGLLQIYFFSFLYLRGRLPALGTGLLRIQFVKFPSQEPTPGPRDIRPSSNSYL